MNDERLKTMYAELVSARAAGGREACVSPEAIRDLVEREGPEPERLATLDHVMACPHCSREFELLRSVDSAGPWLARASGGRRPLAMAATIALLVTATLIWRSSGNQEPTAFRGDTDAVTLVAPSGDVAAASPLQLIWNRLAGAVRYDVEILDEAGNPIWGSTTADTTVLVPDSIAIEAGVDHRWWVRATLPDSRTVRSAMLSFVRR